MHRRWVGKNVNLALLTNHLGEFFKTRDFEAMKGETPKGYQILAANSSRFRLRGYVCLNIEGKPEDFVVESDLCKEKKEHDHPVLDPFTRMFLGGYPFLRRFKSDEAWMKLEKELLQYAENTVLRLTGSSFSEDTTS
jgi:hypothetical protein